MNMRLSTVTPGISEFANEQDLRFIVIKLVIVNDEKACLTELSQEEVDASYLNQI